MAFPTYIGNRECLLEYIVNITPAETPMFTRWGKVAVTNQYVQWQTDALRAATSNGKYPGETYSTSAPNVSTLKHNYCQILTAGYLVTESQIAANPAGRGDELAYQKSKAMKELALDIEYAIVNGTTEQAPASATTPGLMAGLGTGGVLTGNYVSGDAIMKDESAGALTKSMLDAQLKIAWDNGAVEMNTLYAPSKQKLVINAFPGTIRKMDESSDRLAGLVNVYESEFGTLECVKDRRLSDAKIYVMNDDMWKIGVYRPIVSKVLPQTADSQSFIIVGELTLIGMAPQANTALVNLG